MKIINFLDDTIELEESSQSSTQTPSQPSNFSDELIPQNLSYQAGPSDPKKSRGSVNVITEKLVATLDKCQVSDRNAVRIIAAVAESFSCDLSSLIINKTSIRQHRQRIRKKLSEKMKKVFSTSQLSAAVIHWDGKIMKSFHHESGKSDEI